MIVFIYLVVFISIVLILIGSQRLAITGFGIGLILAIVWFIHHATSHLHLNV